MGFSNFKADKKLFWLWALRPSIAFQGYVVEMLRHYAIPGVV